MIPYTIDRRADTGVTNVTMGIWLFLASEVMFFGALFSAYALLSTSAPAWPSGRQILSLPFGLAHTVVLAMVTAAAWRARSATSDRAMRRALAAGAAFGLVFLAAKGIEYRDEIRLGLVPRVNTFMATYFVLTGAHALHVAGGILANAWVIAGARRAAPGLTAGRVRALSLYWIFVDLIWLIVFALMYLR